jgi:hypothetical protein
VKQEHSKRRSVAFRPGSRSGVRPRSRQCPRPCHRTRGPLAFQLLVSDSGQVTGLVRQGSLTPEIESALRAARVVTPGRRGGDPVPMLATVPLTVE